MQNETRLPLYDGIISLVLAGLIAVGAAFVAMFVVFAFSMTITSFRRFGDEGSAWLPISIGIPASAVTGLVAFLVSLVRFAKARAKRVPSGEENGVL